MENWQADLIEAANELSLEVTLYGEGLPGSFVSVALGDVELENMDRAESSPRRRQAGVVYTGMELMVRPSSIHRRTTFILQTPVDSHLHPHISVPYFCWGGNGENIEIWTRDGDWLILLNNCKNLIRQYWPGNAYQTWGARREGCMCLRRLAGLDRGTDYNCDGCTSRCNFCNGGESEDDGVFFEIRSPQFGVRTICSSCANNDALSICPNCGDITPDVIDCAVTGKQICRNCGMRDTDGNIFHREAFVRIAGSSYDMAPITAGSICIGCQNLIPHPDSGYYSRCGRVKCIADLAGIIAQIMEDSSGNNANAESNGESGGEGAGQESESRGSDSPYCSIEDLDTAASQAIVEYAEGYSGSEHHESPPF